MKTKNCTSLEQSEKLIELGIEPTTADMYFEPSVGFCTEPSEIKVGDIKYAHPSSIPAWSLTVLLNILPSATLDSSNDHYYRIHCMKKYTEWYDNAIDACIEMIIWLKENGKI